MRRLKPDLFFAVLVFSIVVLISFSYAAEPLKQKTSPAPLPASPSSSSTPAPILTPVKPELEVRPVGKPDLVISAMSSGLPVKSGSWVEIPFSVRVRNIGKGPAGIFKVSAGYKFISFPMVLASRITVREGGLAFTVPGQSNIMFPFTSTPLSAGGEITFTGRLKFPTIFDSSFDESTPRARIRFEAIADSTQGDGSSVPAYGRVQESNEGNNKSNPVDLEISITRGPGDR